MSTPLNKKFKDFRGYQVTEDEEKAEFIQVLDYRGKNVEIRIDGSIGETYADILQYYYRPGEILDTRYLIFGNK